MTGKTNLRSRQKSGLGHYTPGDEPKRAVAGPASLLAWAILERGAGVLVRAADRARRAFRWTFRRESI